MPREAALTDGQRLGDDFADLHAGIERGERILKNHLHAAPLGTPFSAAKNEEIAVLELNGTGVGGRSGR